jgi:hypothetical protein
MAKRKFLSFKPIAGSTLVLAFLAITGVNVHLVMKAQKASSTSDVMLKNIEALSSGEGTSQGSPCYKGAYNSSRPLAVKCGTPCTMDHVGGSIDSCPHP